MLIILTVELFRKFRIDFLSIFNFSFFIMYGLVPCILTIDDKWLFVNGKVNWADQFIQYNPDSVIINFFILLFYLIFLISYIIINRISLLKESNLKKFPKRSKLTFLIILMLLIGVVSFLLYSKTMGGPVNAIVYAQLQRSGTIKGEGVLTFFKHFIRVVYLAVFVLIALPRIFTKGPKFTFLKLVSLSAMVIAFLVYAGRGGMIIIIATIVVYKITYQNGFVLKPKHILLITILSITSLIIIAYFRPLMYLIAGVESKFETSIFDTVISSFITSLSVPYISLLVAFNNIDINEVFAGRTILLALFDILPNRLLGLNTLYKINTFNTELFGFYIDDREYNIVTGMIAYFFYEFHYWGFFIGAFLIGIKISIMNKLHYIFAKIPILHILSVYFVFQVPFNILAGDWAGSLKTSLITYIFVFILFIFHFRRQQSSIFNQ